MSGKSRAELRKTWQERVDAFRESGMSVAGWCREEGLKEHQMRYWLRQHSPTSESETTWLPVEVREADEMPAGGPGLVVWVQDVAIEVRSGFDRQLLIDLVEILTNRC